MIKRALAFFRGLGGKLTLSYTMVTVGALLVVEAAILVGVLIMVYSSVGAQSLVHTFRQEFANQIRPFLEGEEPNLQGLRAWVKDSFSGQNATVTSRGQASQETQLESSLIGGNQRLYVLDTQARLLAANPEVPPEDLLEPFQVNQVPGLENLLPAALGGDPDDSNLYQRGRGGSLTVAVPVQDGDGRVLGVLVFAIELRPLASANLQPLFRLLGVSLLAITLSAGLVGTIFGFFTSRWLTHRLRRVSQTATVWGQGDFDRTIQDHSNDELGQLSRQLNGMASQLHSLLDTRQSLAALEERNRLARDLHDSVKQQAFAISMNLGAAQELWDRDPVGARQRLNTASGLSRQVQSELSALISTLRAPQLEGRTLEKAVLEHVQAWQIQSGITSNCEIQLRSSLSVEKQEVLFRVLQEALANTARHSGASQVFVRLVEDTNWFCLEVQDNGHGFDPLNYTAGLGLRSMNERLERVQGELHIESSPKGTRVIASVPSRSL